MRVIRLFLFSIIASAAMIFTLTALPPEAEAQCTIGGINWMCPPGQVLRGIDNAGGKDCVTAGGGGTAASCPPGQVLQAFDAAGNAACVTNGGGGGGADCPATGVTWGGSIGCSGSVSSTNDGDNTPPVSMPLGSRKQGSCIFKCIAGSYIETTSCTCYWD